MPKPSRRIGVSSACVAAAFAIAGCAGSNRSTAHRATSTTSSTTSSTTRPHTPTPAVPRVLVAPWQLSRPSAREAVVVDHGGLLVMGGLDGNRQTTAEVLRVDVKTGTTTHAGVLSAAVHDTAGASVHGIATVFGGGNASESAAVQQFPANGTASVVGQLPIPRSDLAAATVGGRTYIVGGYDGASIRATALSTTDGATFAVLGDLPVPVRYPAVAVHGSDVVVIGGVAASGDTASIQVLDTHTGQARVVGTMPKPLSHASAATLRGQVYVFGGMWGGVPSAQVWRWDPPTNALVPIGTLPAPVTDGATATIGNTTYFVGGESPRPDALVTELRIG